MTERKLIAISGSIQVGKSTLIRKLLDASDLPVCGFMTKLAREDKVPGKGWPLYIYPAALAEKDRVKSPANLLGYPGPGDPARFRDVFDGIAYSFLEDIPEDAIVVMDELGNMETSSEKFMNRVFEVIHGKNPVILAIKARFEFPFLARLRSEAGGNYYWITEENRDRIAQELIPVVRGWNRTDRE